MANMMRKIFKTKRLKLHREYLKNGIYRIWKIGFLVWAESKQ